MTRVDGAKVYLDLSYSTEVYVSPLDSLEIPDVH